LGKIKQVQRAALFSQHSGVRLEIKGITSRHSVLKIVLEEAGSFLGQNADTA
jgi:hypothetical protein